MDFDIKSAFLLLPTFMEFRLRAKLYLITMVAIAGACFAVPASASETNGTITSPHFYAWGSKIGWVNFGCDNCGVAITDSALTGYFWSANYGWINLNPTNGGVNNTSAGVLSGYAWGQNLGWINFSGVTINSGGVFRGQATGDNVGTLNFECDNCSVKTDWRPSSARTTAATTVTTGGGGMPPEAYSPPQEAMSISINDGAAQTGANTVYLRFSAGANVKRMSVSNFSDFRDAPLLPYYPLIEWNLCEGISDNPLCAVLTASSTPPGEGKMTVYVKFFTDWGLSSGIFSDDIIFKPLPLTPGVPEAPPYVLPPTPPTPEVKQTFIKKIYDLLKLILPEFLSPKPLSKESIKFLERVVTIRPPSAMRVVWQLLPELQIRRFVFAPIPRTMARVVMDFPEMKGTFAALGVNRMTDVVRLSRSGAKFTLPGLGTAVKVQVPKIGVKPGEEVPGMPAPKLGAEVSKWPQGVPFVKLSPEIRKRLPSEVIFVKSGSELIDYNMSFSVNNKGQAEEQIRTVAGKPLHLAVKPKGKVKSVMGYLVFREKRKGALQEVSLAPEGAAKNPGPAADTGGSFAHRFIQRIPFGAALGSLFFSDPVLAGPADKLAIENLLKLMEFEYTDPDGDGLYTADIYTPVVDGEYEIITIINYVDPALGAREIRMVAVVDPEGYVYEKIGDRELRIPNVAVALYWLNPGTKQYELWPARDYQQENEQITDITGKYSFLVPPGIYNLRATAPGYAPYQSADFDVTEGSGVHFNIELKAKYSWQKTVDWKTTLLVIVILLLGYNFYSDRRRDREEKSSQNKN